MTSIPPIITPPPPPKRVLGVPLVKDASSWHRWWSMRWIIIGAFCAGAAAAYQWMPADWLPEIPSWVKMTLGLGAVFSMGAAGVSRVIQQPQPFDPRLPPQ